MKYKFYFRVGINFVDNIVAMMISEYFSSQYRIYTSGKVEKILSRGYFSSEVNKWVATKLWRIGEPEELALYLDRDQFNIFRTEYYNRTGFEVTYPFNDVTFYINNNMGWEDQRILALTISSDIKKQIRIYIDGTVISSPLIYSSYEIESYCNSQFWKKIDLSEICKKLECDKGILFKNLKIALDKPVEKEVSTMSNVVKEDINIINICKEDYDLCRNEDMQIYLKLHNKVKEIIKEFYTYFQFAGSFEDTYIWYDNGEKKINPLSIYRINPNVVYKKEIIGFNVVVGVGPAGTNYYIKNNKGTLVLLSEVASAEDFFMIEYNNKEDTTGTTTRLKDRYDLVYGNPVKVFLKK